MSVLTEHVEIGARLNQQWADYTPIAWPNIAFNAPKVNDTNAQWIALFINDDPPPAAPGSIQRSIGSPGHNIVRYTGTIIVQCFTALAIGNLPVLTLADKVEQIFNKWEGSYVKCRIATTKDIGPDKNGWYQANVTIPFYRDELM